MIGLRCGLLPQLAYFKDNGYEDMKKINFLPPSSTLAIVLVAVLVSACGDGDKAARAEKSAVWLRQYSKTNPPNKMWETIEVKVKGSDKVVMEVMVKPEQQVTDLKFLPKINKAGVVQLACPSSDAEIWHILGSDIRLWINLNGPDGYIIGATCRH